jgi:DNA repair protein RadC
MQQHTTIRGLPKADRPRQKLLTSKPKTLTNTELLSLIIGTGTKSRNAVELAADILNTCHQDLAEFGRLSVTDFLKIPGIGPAKAAAISASIELQRRRQSEQSLERHFIRNSMESALYIRPLIVDESVEVFAVLYLVQAGWIKSFEIVHTGGITSTTVDLRLIFARALELQAVSIIVAHNHPSGSLRPSKADEALTAKLHQASKIMDVKLLDSLIVSDKGYFSFADEGLVSIV